MSERIPIGTDGTLWVEAGHKKIRLRFIDGRQQTYKRKHITSAQVAAIAQAGWEAAQNGLEGGAQ